MGFPVEVVSLPPNQMDVWVVVAAWVQAVGSIAAIIAAFLITNHDRHETARMARDQRISALASIIFKGDDLLRNLYTDMTAAGEAARSTVLTQDRTGELGDAIGRVQAVLGAVPLHELDWELARAVMEMQQALANGHSAIREILSAGFYDAFGSSPTEIKYEKFRASVNLAGKAVARVGQAAHRNSKDQRARKYRITAQIV